MRRGPVGCRGKSVDFDMTAPWATSLPDNITPGLKQPGQVQESEAGMDQKRSDRINSVFELAGGFFILFHIVRVLHDKSVAGVSPITIAFFTLWGYWNLYYYRSIQQRWSLRATYLIIAMNSVWLVLLIYYSMKGV